MKKIIPYEPYLVPIANKLRKSMTYSERLIWNRIKNKQLMGYDFHRQKPILKFIVDFYCYELMLAIEIDGITHFDNGNRDQLRQEVIETLGINFLRFDALEVVKNPDSTVQSIGNWILEKIGG
jgi:very-short-patch-repair endonuclease